MTKYTFGLVWLLVLSSDCTQQPKTTFKLNWKLYLNLTLCLQLDIRAWTPTVAPQVQCKCQCSRPPPFPFPAAWPPTPTQPVSSIPVPTSPLSQTPIKQIQPTQILAPQPSVSLPPISTLHEDEPDPEQQEHKPEQQEPRAYTEINLGGGKICAKRKKNVFAPPLGAPKGGKTVNSKHLASLVSGKSII